MNEIPLISEDDKKKAEHLKKSLFVSDTLIKACEGELFPEE